MSTFIDSTSLGNLIIVTGSFLLLFVLLRIFAWNQITGIFDARAKKISDDLDAAENARKAADELVVQRKEELSQAYKLADQILIDAKATGENLRNNIVSKAEKEVDVLKDKGQKDVERMRADALVDIKSQVASLSLEIAQELVMKEITASGQSELIDRYLNSLGE